MTELTTNTPQTGSQVIEDELGELIKPDLYREVKGALKKMGFSDMVARRLKLRKEVKDEKGRGDVLALPEAAIVAETLRTMLLTPEAQILLLEDAQRDWESELERTGVEARNSPLLDHYYGHLQKQVDDLLGFVQGERTEAHFGALLEGRDLTSVSNTEALGILLGDVYGANENTMRNANFESLKLVAERLGQKPREVVENMKLVPFLGTK